MVTNHEPSHWHSAPLALALFPALGGLFFHNGSVVVTDLTLLILAAVFLNWAVRLPWSAPCPLIVGIAVADIIAGTGIFQRSAYE